MVGDDQVKRRIMEERAFRNTLGQFDPGVYRRVLAENGFTEDRYVATMRSDIARDHLTGVIPAAAVAPRQLADQLFRYRGEKRVADVVTVPRGSVESVADPDEATLAEFHKTNSAMFMVPELRDLTLIHLDPAEVAAQMKPTDEQIREEYEHRRGTFEVPERRTVRQMLATDEETAKRASAALKQGADFTATAKDVAGRTEESTRLGSITRRDLPAELADVVFKLEPNVPSEPVGSPLGWHIFLVDRIDPGKVPTVEDVKEQLVREIAHEMAIDAIVKNANRLEDTLAGGATLEETAAQFGARLAKIDGMDTLGRGKDGTAKAGIPKGRRFLETAFATGARETSLLTEAGDGGYFVVRVDAITPSELRPLDEVKTQAIAAWKRSRLDDAAKARATKIRDQARGGAALRQLAEAEKLTVVTTKPFTRQTSDPESVISPELANQLFQVAKGGIEMGATTAGYAVAQVTEIVAADPVADKDLMDQLGEQLKSGLVADLVAQYTAALRSTHSVSINQRALERLTSEGGGRN
jgi:peptidyl-prolyl cis-trans isomerase D